MRKVLLLALAAVFVLSFVGTALAVAPPVTDLTAPANGRSAWSYQDLQDPAGDAGAKYEGAYAEFDGANLLYDESPHGGYDTSTNKCQVCHAVHRAEGAYYLLRADSQSDACDYCHIGSSAHSGLVVYDLNTAGKDTPNGHTIGASSTIPDSSTSQQMVEVPVSAVDADGNDISETITVRSYSATRLQMYRQTAHHGHRTKTGATPGTGSSNLGRVGPVALSCLSCHQVHNAANAVWRTAEVIDADGAISATRGDGYKLLKRLPSASINPTNSRWIKVPEATLVAGTNYSTTTSGAANYSEWGDTAPAGGFSQPLWVAGLIGGMEAGSGDPATDGASVSNLALSVWCADCHNLDIGGSQPQPKAELGVRMHTERTHPVPFISEWGPGQCYSCHRNDLSGSYDTVANVVYPARSNCQNCHYGTGAYWQDRVNATTKKASDFPHSGADSDMALLGSFSLTFDGSSHTPTSTNFTTITPDNLDAVCLRCHAGIGTNH